MIYRIGISASKRTPKCGNKTALGWGKPFIKELEITKPATTGRKTASHTHSKRAIAFNFKGISNAPKKSNAQQLKHSRNNRSKTNTALILDRKPSNHIKKTTIQRRINNEKN